MGEDSECLHLSFLPSLILAVPSLCTVFLLDDASTRCGYPSLLTWLCTSLSAGLPRWSFLALFHSHASSTSGTDSSASYPCCVWSFSRSLSLSLKLVCCRLEICNIVPGDCRLRCCLLEVGCRHVLDLAVSHRLDLCGVTTVFCATLINS